MAELMQDLCGRCRYFYPVDGGADGSGQCRRFPPVLVVMPALNELRQGWPILFIDDGCGEFRPLDSTDDRPGPSDAG
jgi:hypothetical protein